MTAQKKDMDMINGSLWNKILIFAIPIAVSALMQQLFHSADMAVIGQFAGKNELAAVGSNNSIINLLINIFMGFSAGSNVVIAQFIGAGKTDLAKKSVATSLVIAAASGIIVMLLGVSFSRLLLELISSPPEIIDLATLYLRLYFLGTPFIMLYNFSAAILRSRGETTKPFFCLLAGGIVNVILNLIFVIYFRWSVAGVAVATTASNILSSFLILRILLTDKGELGITLKDIKPDKSIIRKIVKIGLPMGIQSALFPLSNLVVQSAINSLGTVYVAASAAALAIETYSYSIMTGFVQAIVSFVSQNFGAGKIDRCRKSLRLGITFNFIISNVFNIIMLICADKVIGLFTTDPQVALYTKERLIFMYAILWSCIFMDSTTNALRGMGYSIFPTVVSVAGVCGFRIIWIYTAFRYFGSFISILAVYPISWVITSIPLLIFYFIKIKKLQKQTL